MLMSKPLSLLCSRTEPPQSGLFDLQCFDNKTKSLLDSINAHLQHSSSEQAPFLGHLCMRGSCAWETVLGERSASRDLTPEQNLNAAFLAATTEGQQCLPAAGAPLEPIPKLGRLLLLTPGCRAPLEARWQTLAPSRGAWVVTGCMLLHRLGSRPRRHRRPLGRRRR